MARVRKAFRGVSPEPVMMVCVEAVSGFGMDCKAGGRYLSDEPLVKQYPEYFVPWSGGDRAIAQRKQELFEAVEARVVAGRAPEPPKPEPPPPTPPEDLVICIRGVGLLGSSVPMANFDKGEPRGIRTGDVVPRRYKLVKQNPTAFVDVLPPGLKVEDAWVTTETLVQYAADGTTQTLYKGQMVAKESFWLRLHPHHFTRPWLVGMSPDQPEESYYGIRVGALKTYAPMDSVSPPRP